MRHFISLGIRGVMLEFGGLLMRVQGGLSYQLLLRRNRNRIREAQARGIE